MRRAWIWSLVVVGIALAVPRTALQAQETRHVWIGESREEDRESGEAEPCGKPEG